jgi:hypothetical protein
VPKPSFEKGAPACLDDAETNALRSFQTKSYSALHPRSGFALHAVLKETSYASVRAHQSRDRSGIGLE